MDKPIDKSNRRTGKSGSAGAERVRRHREKMKAMGLKPVTLWLPDVDSPEYKARIAQACEAINADEESRRVLEGMLELSDFSDWK
jgi:hypothetical protein